MQIKECSLGGGGGPGGRGGGGVVQAQLTKKLSDKVFFLVLNLQFYRGGPIIYFKENYIFYGSRGCPTFSRGWGVQGSKCYFLKKSIERVIFRGGGRRTPHSSSGSAHGRQMQTNTDRGGGQAG